MTMIMCLTLCKPPLPSACLGMNDMSTRAGNKAPRRIRNHRIVQLPQLPQVCSDPGQVLYYLSAIVNSSRFPQASGLFDRHCLSPSGPSDLGNLSVVRTDRLSRGSRFRSEEHTSELQSHSDLVCRLLLEKKKKQH